MYKPIALTNSTQEIIKLLNREEAENLANSYFSCIDVYSVAVVSSNTGELVFYRAKEG